MIRPEAVRFAPFSAAALSSATFAAAAVRVFCISCSFGKNCCGSTLGVLPFAPSATPALTNSSSASVRLNEAMFVAIATPSEYSAFSSSVCGSAARTVAVARQNAIANVKAGKRRMAVPCQNEGRANIPRSAPGSPGPAIEAARFEQWADLRSLAIEILEHRQCIDAEAARQHLLSQQIAVRALQPAVSVEPVL